MSTPREWRRVYLASPIPTYWTRRYERHLERLQGLAPAAQIVEPRNLGWDSGAWLAEGREVIAGCDALVAFGLAGGVIGRGVWQELVWARELGLATFHIKLSGPMVPDPVAVQLPGGSWRSWAVLKSEGQAA
ncbi:MAG: hypothetical protein ACYDEA_03470 [Candidatus Dormibacteria bacterium]